MHISLEGIAKTLRAAREQKGLTQRDLAQRTGLPQSHVSKIENATVDLQTSSLMELARVLDLELTLIPRSLIPAVQALQRESHSRVAPAYRLDDDGEDGA
jgi:transcriptional regulator with XRE-family HTH domain